MISLIIKLGAMVMSLISIGYLADGITRTWDSYKTMSVFLISVIVALTGLLFWR